MLLIFDRWALIIKRERFVSTLQPNLQFLSNLGVGKSGKNCQRDSELDRWDTHGDGLRNDFFLLFEIKITTVKI